MNPAADHDVIVVGAGPAGTSAAIRLAEMGFDVGLVERTQFPRGHVGICIPDETVCLVDFLGIGHRFENARFWRRELTAVKWGDTETVLVPQRGYQLDRGEFDAMLLEKAASAGATVYQPAQVQEAECIENSVWTLTIETGRARRILRTRFVVDATGRRPVIRGARVKDGPPLLAIHAVWECDRACSFDGLIESGVDAWLWFARNSRETALVTVFCDPRRSGLMRTGDLSREYESLLCQFGGVSDILRQPLSAPEACDATSRHAKEPVGDKHIRLGDACFAVDPLSSQGVHLALQSGLQGAIVVNTILSQPTKAENARQFFRTSMERRAARYSDRTGQEYARVADTNPDRFWGERSGIRSLTAILNGRPNGTPPECTDKVALSPATLLAVEPVIDGHYVELRHVVSHPSFDGSIKYLENVDLIPLLSTLPKTFSYGEISVIWRNHVAPHIADKIAAWMWTKGLLVRI
ncbi:NAD(P)/FAD-dependent oxidoreductase [Rhizobium ruizarguesonis]